MTRPTPKFAPGDLVRIVAVGCDCGDSGPRCWRHHNYIGTTATVDEVSLEDGVFGYIVDPTGRVDPNFEGEQWFADELQAVT